ncbi:formyltransferase family protein, partial [Streptococcus pasteurianus]
KYRGGAPVHYAIGKGEKETGISIIRMVKKMDAGAILKQAAIPIDDQVTVAEMFDRLSELGSQVLLETLPALFNGTVTET